MAAPVELTGTDATFLERARTLAHRGWGRVHPNPMVGCVLVRNGEVVGEGFHGEFGGPHAEVVALEAALGRTAGATAYVSLEPCDHHGKTPPCSRALVDAGVTRVVYGAADPGRASGGGAATLRTAGIEVVGPVWSAAESFAENPAFHHGAAADLPFVALKLAMTLDARIADAPGRRSRITGAEAEQEVHRLRTGYDAVMVGAGTVRSDDPRLTARLVVPGRQAPRRVLLLPDAELARGAAVLDGLEEAPVHAFCREDAAESAMEHLEEAGVHVHPVPGKGDVLDLDAVLRACRELGIESILCEGGAELAASLLREGLVGRLLLFVAPRALGGAGLPAFGEDAGEIAWDRFTATVPPRRFGADTLITLDRVPT